MVVLLTEMRGRLCEGHVDECLMVLVCVCQGIVGAETGCTMSMIESMCSEQVLPTSQFWL